MKTRLLITLLLCVIGGWNADAQTQFWGTTMSGGANNGGTIFTMDANGNNFQNVYSFIDSLGEVPVGNVVLANNGKLYGVTLYGGFGDSCVIYSYEPYTGIYTKIYDFYQNIQFGWDAVCGMIKANNGLLYGLCAKGGAHGRGAIFKVDPATDLYSDIFDFNMTNGDMPFGSLVQLNNGILYGLTSGGGQHGGGVIFSFDPTNNSYTKLYDFNSPSGWAPWNGALIQAANSKLYGLTESGGAYNDGVLFSFDLSTNVYTNLYDFDSIHGRMPLGSLIEASNGVLYGMTNEGGIQDSGVIFSYDIAANNYTVLHEFQIIDGANPQRSLTEGSNGKLYGTTLYGGAYNYGVAFSYNIATSTYTKLIDFSTAIGMRPDGEFIETPILTPTGIPALVAANEGAVYPNPATNTLTVTGREKEEVVEFFDVAGRELLLLKISANSKTDVNISHFPNMFFMKKQNGEVRKIVKE